MKRIVSIILCCITFISFTAYNVSAETFVPYSGYEYNTKDESVPAPVGYLPEAYYLGSDIGSGALVTPTDMCFYNGELYILDSGNSRIVVTDENLKLVREIGEITVDGKALNYKGANGIFVCDTGNILIADTESMRIIEAENDGTGVQVLEKPNTPMIADSIKYSVKKVIRDFNGVTYALVDGINDGAVTYMPDGSFGGFFAINEVEQTAKVILNYLWKRFMTEEQIRNSVTSAPSSITNFDIAEKGFMYTVTQSSQGESSVRLLNFKGSNLETENEYGDLEWDRKIKDSLKTTFCDVEVDDEQYIYLLDSARGRVFVYSKDGIPITIFGGKGEKLGQFLSTTALETHNGKTYVLDNLRGSVTVFLPNEYFLTVKTAQNLLDKGSYTEARAYWEKVLKINSNSTIAYYGIGLALDEAGQYKEALKYFKLSYSNKAYSDAYKEVRKEFVKENFTWLILLGVALIVGIIFLSKYLKKKFGRKNAYEKSSLERKFSAPLFTMFHPMDGFEALKLKKGWSLSLSFGILSLLFVALTAKWFLTGFSYNTNRASDYNVFITLLQAFIIVIVCVIANWAVCTLIEGKGKLADIFNMICYSLVPYILSIFVCVILTNMMTLEESAFVAMLNIAGITWSGILIFTGFMSIHQFGFSKNVLSIIMTVIGVAVIIFLAILFVGLMQQVISFIRSISSEVVLMS